MSERLTFKEMQDKYPDQWLGLVDVRYVDDDHSNISSAVVKIVGKGKFELSALRRDGLIDTKIYTTPDRDLLAISSTEAIHHADVDF